MKTDIWTEPKGPLLRDALMREARRWQSMHRPPESLADWQAWRHELRARIGDARLAHFKEGLVALLEILGEDAPE